MSHSSVFPGGHISGFLILIHSSLKLAYVHASRLNLGHGASNVPAVAACCPSRAVARILWYRAGPTLSHQSGSFRSNSLPPGPHQICYIWLYKSMSVTFSKVWPAHASLSTMAAGFQSTLQAPIASAMSVPNQDALVPELYLMMMKMKMWLSMTEYFDCLRH